MLYRRYVVVVALAYLPFLGLGLGPLSPAAAQSEEEDEGQNGLKPPGDCSKQEHRALKQLVGHFCKSKPLKCESILTCQELTVRWARGVLCRESRQQIMDRCFRGGDEEHKREVSRATKNVTECEQLMRDRGCRFPDEDPRTICEEPKAK